MPSDPLLLIGLVAVICGLGVFFDWFYKKVPWAEKPINGLKIWGVIMVLVMLLAFIV